jgi:hypothetical protein
LKTFLIHALKIPWLQQTNSHIRMHFKRTLSTVFVFWKKNVLPNSQLGSHHTNTFDAQYYDKKDILIKVYIFCQNIVVAFQKFFKPQASMIYKLLVFIHIYGTDLSKKINSHSEKNCIKKNVVLSFYGNIGSQNNSCDANLHKF